MKRVSVVIPTYKRSHTVTRAIDSVLRQTHKHLTIIVVDDNGKGTPEQLETEARLRPYIHRGCVNYLVQPRNLGANAARNAGVRASEGEFVAFLDDDDEWLEEKLSRQLCVFESDDQIGVVYTKVLIKYDDLNLQYTTNPRARGDIHDDLLIENCVGTPASALIKREALVDNLLDETLPARQDYDLWLRLSRTWKFEVIDDVLAIVHARNTTSRISADVSNYVRAIEIIERKYASELGTLPPRARVLRKAEQNYFLGAQAIKANRPDLARSFFAASLRARFSKKSLLAFALSFLGTRATVYARALLASRHK